MPIISFSKDEEDLQSVAASLSNLSFLSTKTPTSVTSAPVPTARVTQTRYPLRTNGTGLSFNIQKQFAEDILKLGSLHSVTIGSICSKYPEKKKLYGDTKTSEGKRLRKKFNNKLTHWRANVSDQDFPAVAKAIPKRSCTTNATEDQFNIEAPASPLSNPASPKQPTPKMDTYYDDDIPEGAIVINVDIHRFENNREFRVYTCRDLPGEEDGTFFDGYLIVYRDLDIRDIIGTDEEPARDDAFTAKFVPPNHVVIGVPALNYGERGHDADEINAYIGEKNMRTAMNTALNRFDKDMHRKRNVKTFDLQFPSDICLSLDKLKGASRTGEMEYELLPIEVDLPDLQEDPLELITVIINGKKVEAFKYVKFSKPVLMWKIAIDEDGRDDSDLKKKKPVSKGKAALLAAKNKRKARDPPSSLDEHQAMEEDQTEAETGLIPDTPDPVASKTPILDPVASEEPIPDPSSSSAAVAMPDPIPDPVASKEPIPDPSSSSAAVAMPDPAGGPPTLMSDQIGIAASEDPDPALAESLQCMELSETDPADLLAAVSGEVASLIAFSQGTSIEPSEEKKNLDESRRLAFKPIASSAKKRFMSLKEKRKAKRAEKQAEKREVAPAPINPPNVALPESPIENKENSRLDKAFVQNLLDKAADSHAKTKTSLTVSAFCEETIDGAPQENQTKEALSEEEQLELELKRVQHAHRLAKAEEYLLGLKELDLKNGSSDTAWIEEKLADLDDFVEEYRDDLDALIEKEGPTTFEEEFSTSA